MKLLSRLYKYWTRYQFLGYLVVFVVAFIFFFWLQYYPTFADPDSFYHTKMALLIRDIGIIKNFPWLGEFTILGNYYTDQHLGYHAFLSLFTFYLHPISGVKLATALLGSLLVMLNYWLYRSFRLRGALFFSLFLLLISPFTFRISLVKSPVVSIIFLVLALYFLFKEKTWSLFILGFAYVWTYGGFPLLLVVTVLYALINQLRDKIFYHQKVLKREKKWYQNKNLQQVLASLGGIILGLVINPYFPQNLFFYERQLIKIGIINFQDKIGVGGEWYPYQFSTLLSNTGLLMVMLVAVIVLGTINYKKQSARSLALFLLTLFFLFLTLKSRRYVEYFVPFTFLFSTFSLNDSLAELSVEKIKKFLQSAFWGKKILVFLIGGYFLVTIPYLIIRDQRANYQNLKNGIPYNKFEKVSKWLKSNSQKGDIVLHSDWDDFPVLFYQNDYNYYIVGLDPTFMYDYNEDLYWKWVNITTGKGVNNLEKTVEVDLKSSYVLVEKDHESMNNLFKENQSFTLKYEDDEVWLYEVL